MSGRSAVEWLNISPKIKPDEAQILSRLGLSVYFPPSIQRRLDEPLRINARYRQLLRDVADGYVLRPAVSGMWDTNDRNYSGVALSIARLHGAGLVDLDSCPGRWHLTKAGHQALREQEAD